MAQDYLLEVKKMLLAALEGLDADVFLYGSRADGSASRGSDVDVGVNAGHEVDARLLQRARNILEESAIPFKVDIVDFARVDGDFRTVAMKKVQWWKRKKARN